MYNDSLCLRHELHFNIAIGSKVHQTDSIGTNAIEHIDVIYGTISYNAITSVK